ncbi:pyridoxal-dependent decarboxylase [Bacillus carboniphilus]|uniref:Pyridoxal-dependent decarboxylase n=1 Tax=Bacillus carboniphilus TaxID=86663 RepID=A0ABY9JYB5_9BACI|nr:pyridoxal-dependent decarboxylase [Bacillus carboniphilus]WLR44374.1 pyridoxal-dependent decarboxylase [Bacillus carboniphilus]
MKEMQQLFPSIDGNEQQRNDFLGYVSELVSKLDELKDPKKLSLGEMPDYTKDYYEQVMNQAMIPENGVAIQELIDQLIELAKGQRYINSNYVANAVPLPNIPSLLGNLLMVLTNGNGLWDVEGAAPALAEVKITSMLSKMIGYNPEKSGGYTTWGGQGAVFNSLRLAITRQFPESNKEGIPNNLYCFCSELSHYSLYKSVEATGIGINNMIRVKVNDDHSMNIDDLKEKIEAVIANGGIPLYILATMGTTDTFGIDSIKEIKEVAMKLEDEHNLKPIYIHADSAMGGMYTFFNDYDFAQNPLDFEPRVCDTLSNFQSKFKFIHLADSMVFDFHKLGQTPYISSLFLVKNKSDLVNVDLDSSETPYIGNRGYGSYHTSYTLECSRMGSSITILASLLGLGIEGYQRLLANYILVNHHFRDSLKESFSNVAVTNEVSPITTFRFYQDEVVWEKEKNGELTIDEIREINDYNDGFAELIGIERDVVYFGNTKKQRLILPKGSEKRIPIYAHKFFSISPYTTVEEVERYIGFLKDHMNMYEKQPVLM